MPRPRWRFSRAPGRVASEQDLFGVRQYHGETLRAFTERFTQLRDRIPRISDRVAILAFKVGVADRGMRRVLCLRGGEVVVYPMLVTLAYKQASS